MLGYIFLFITGVFYVGLAMLTASKPSFSGDNAMGYGLGLFFLGLGFTISSLILSIVGLSKGSFDWVTQDGSSRTMLVLFVWLLMALTTFFCAVFKWEWHNDTVYPQFLHWIAVRHGQLWIPLLWLFVTFLSLNPNGHSAISIQAFRIPFWTCLVLSAVYSGGLLIGYLRDSVKTAEAETASQKEQGDRWHQINLDTIAAQKPDDPIIRLLSYSTRFRPDDIREAAITKIKAHPNWEAEILELLNDKKAYREVYYFLDGNRVEHPQQFTQPLNQSMLWTAESIKADIEDSNNLQSWSFDIYLIDRLLRAIDDQFLDKGVDFYPNVVKIKEALTTPPPERFKGVRFTATDEVDRWLKAHRR